MPRIAMMGDSVVVGAWYRNGVTEEIGQVIRDDGASLTVKNIAPGEHQLAA